MERKTLLEVFKKMSDGKGVNYYNNYTKEEINIYTNIKDIVDYEYCIDGKPIHKFVFVNKNSGAIEEIVNPKNLDILIENNYMYSNKEIYIYDDKSFDHDGCFKITPNMSINAFDSVVVKKIYLNRTEYEIYGRIDKYIKYPLKDKIIVTENKNILISTVNSIKIYTNTIDYNTIKTIDINWHIGSLSRKEIDYLTNANSCVLPFNYRDESLKYNQVQLIPKTIFELENYDYIQLESYYNNTLHEVYLKEECSISDLIKKKY